MVSSSPSRAFFDRGLVGPVSSVPVLPQLHTRPWSSKETEEETSQQCTFSRGFLLHSRLRPIIDS